MSILLADCPRCGAQSVTFNVLAQLHRSKAYSGRVGIYIHSFELFCACRHCKKSTTFNFVMSDGGNETIDLMKAVSVNDYGEVRSYLSLKDESAVEAPEHVPAAIANAFREGATCRAVECWNAAATMFRLCVDMATREMLPEVADGLNAKVRRDLGMRLPWLFDNKVLPEDLRELSSCIKEDGNDGAHAGSLTAADAEDLLDFTTALLGRLYTEPERLKLAKQRRVERRTSPASQSSPQF